MSNEQFLTTMRKLRQSRKYTGEPVDADTLHEILEVARWSGSSKNGQPWQLVVVDDKELLERLARVREANIWLEDAAFAIAIVTPGVSDVSERYDEGRMAERIMLAADVLGLGSGTAWFSTPEQQAGAKAVLGIPEDQVLWEVVVVGHIADVSAKTGSGGRKALEEIVSYNQFGQRTR